MKSELLYPTEGKGRSYTVEGRTGANSGLCLRAGGAGSGLCARPLEAPGHAQHLAMERGVVAESGWAFHAAGGILDWPVLHRNRFKFSLFPAEVQTGDSVCLRALSWPQGHRAPTTHCFQTSLNRCHPSLCELPQGRQGLGPH